MIDALSARIYADLIGKPFLEGGRGPSAYDCLGLVMELQRRRGLSVPAYLSDEGELHRQTAAGGALDDCLRLQEALPGCLVLMRSVDGAERHLGVMVDRYWMLHASKPAGGVVREVLERSLWGRRVLGFYRVESQP